MQKDNNKRPQSFEKKSNSTKKFTSRNQADKNKEKPYKKSNKSFAKSRFDKGARRPNDRRQRGDFNKGRKPQERKPNGLARLIAYKIIQDITLRGAYTSLAINNALKANKLSDVDKRLVTNIVYTTIENIIRIDYCIDKFMKEPSYEPALRDILRLSVAQLLFMDKIPDFAVINEAVNLMKKVSDVEAWQAVVNGVLRNIVRSKENLPWPSEEDTENYLSIMYSMPLWLVQKLINVFGIDEAKKIITYSNKENYTCIRPNLMRISIENFEKMLENKKWEYKKGIVPNSYLIKHIDSISQDTDYQNGMFSVQGQSSMLAAMAVDNELGMNVLDACAAPGGKTMYMAEHQQGTGRVYAWDIYPHRVELIRQQMYRLEPGNVRISQCDASWYRPELSEFFDRVLIDAPCSNLGVLSEKPDLLMKLNEQGLDTIKELQAKILENCAKYLKVGGVLVYSTCSILPEENDEQIAQFLKKNPNFSITDFPDDFPEKILEHKGEIGIRLYPHSSSLEGFYIARLVKNE